MNDDSGAEDSGTGDSGTGDGLPPPALIPLLPPDGGVTGISARVGEAAGQGWGAPQDAARHIADPQSGATTQAGHVEPGHAQSAQQTPSHQVPQSEQASHIEAGQSPSAQHAHSGETGNAAQHSTAGVERTGSRASKWRHARPRSKMLMVGGTTTAAAALTVGAITLANQNDSSSAQKPPAVTTTIAAAPVSTNAPVVVATTRVPAVATTAPATTEAPTTTVETTTTVPPLASFAGTYAVTVGDLTVSGEGISTVVPGSAAEPWIFSGVCDGVGECTITAEGEAVASTGASPFAGPGGQIVLVPAGPGSYTSTYEFAVDECGLGTGNIVINLSEGALSGTWNFAITGGSTCGFGSVSAGFAGTLTG